MRLASAARSRVSRDPVLGQLPQLALRAGRNETGLQEPMLHQVADPHGILDIGLAPRDRLHVRGVHHKDRDPRGLEEIVQRLPIDPGALHRDVRHLLLQQPVHQRQQFWSRRAIRPGLASFRYRHVYRDRLLVDITPRAPFVEDLHTHRCRAPLRRLVATRHWGTLPRVLTRRWRQCVVLRVARVRLTCGLSAPERFRPLCRRRAGFLLECLRFSCCVVPDATCGAHLKAIRTGPIV